MATKKVEKKLEETSEDKVETVEETVKSIKEVKIKKEPKVYKDDDLITCRSVVPGTLILVGKKSRNRYIFSNIDDTCEIEVRDLNASRASKSMYLFAPKFIIEDEEFISQPKYAELKKLYDSIKNSDVNELLEKPLSEFKAILKNLPIGYKDALTGEMSTRIQNGEFDSINKIRAVDETFGTELMLLIG